MIFKGSLKGCSGAGWEKTFFSQFFWSKVVPNKIQIITLRHTCVPLKSTVFIFKSLNLNRNLWRFAMLAGWFNFRISFHLKEKIYLKFAFRHQNREINFSEIHFSTISFFLAQRFFACFSVDTRPFNAARQRIIVRSIYCSLKRPKVREWEILLFVQSPRLIQTLFFFNYNRRDAFDSSNFKCN